jgi:hypothetical protein
VVAEVLAALLKVYRIRLVPDQEYQSQWQQQQVHLRHTLILQIMDLIVYLEVLRPQVVAVADHGTAMQAARADQAVAVAQLQTALDQTVILDQTTVVIKI